jgi:ribosomal protein L11 methyltransferase
VSVPTTCKRLSPRTCCGANRWNGCAIGGPLTEPSLTASRQVFGDEGHPTTEMARREVLAAAAGCRFADVGTGTGVLAACAVSAGARQVLAIDRDPAAVAIARRRVPSAIVVAGEAPLALSGQFDLIAVNIAEPDLCRLLPALSQRLRDGGRLIATGALLWQGPRLLRTLRELDLQVEAPRASRGWCLAVGQRHRLCR